MRDRSQTTLDFNRLRGAIARGFDSSSTLIVPEIKDRLGVPVGYEIGPRGGTKIIRSKPGENPRKETGELQESIAGETIIDSDAITLLISSDAEHAKYLDPGMQRIIFTDVAEEFVDVVLDKIIESIQQTFSE